MRCEEKFCGSLENILLKIWILLKKNINKFWENWGNSDITVGKVYQIIRIILPKLGENLLKIFVKFHQYFYNFQEMISSRISLNFRKIFAVN